LNRHFFKRTGQAIAGYYTRYGLLPKSCLTCGRVGKAAFCKFCHQELECLDPGCQRCGNPQVHQDSTECAWCERLNTLPERTLTAYAYRQRGREVFHWVKYRGYWRLLDRLCSGLESSWEASFLGWEKPVLVPIPESFSRRWRRHFNPAGQIAKRLADHFGGEVRSLLKIRWFQPSMVGLDYQARRKNAKNRFVVRSRDIPTTVILVDDVLTTGATMEAASKVLKKAGVRRIGWLALFRTL